MRCQSENEGADKENRYEDETTSTSWIWIWTGFPLLLLSIRAAVKKIRRMRMAANGWSHV